MSGTLEIDNKIMHSIKSAMAQTSYSRDYITRLAREQKIVAAQIGRQWYIDIDSLKNYETVSALEQKIRQQHLSVERKQERAARELVEAKVIAKQHVSRKLSRQAKVLALGVILCGVGTGIALNQIAVALPSLKQQVAQAPLMQQMQGYATSVEGSGADGLFKPVSLGGAYQLEFAEDAMNLRTLDAAESGVLLLSGTASAQVSDPSELFSDEVRVVNDAFGRQSFQRVDAQSGEIRNLSFVMVPVDPPKTP